MLYPATKCFDLFFGRSKNRARRMKLVSGDNRTFFIADLYKAAPHIWNVTGGLKVLNFGGIKMPTSTAFGFETKGCVDAEIGGLSHVERTAQTGNEHQ